MDKKLEELIKSVVREEVRRICLKEAEGKFKVQGHCRRHRRRHRRFTTTCSCTSGGCFESCCAFCDSCTTSGSCSFTTDSFDSSCRSDSSCCCTSGRRRRRHHRRCRRCHRRRRKFRCFTTSIGSCDS